VAAPGTVNIMHSLEVLVYMAGVHAAPADSVLVGERLLEDSVWTDGTVPWYWNLSVGVSVPACDALRNGCGQRSRSFRSGRNGGRRDGALDIA
jgi:hypothetical protein